MRTAPAKTFAGTAFVVEYRFPHDPPGHTEFAYAEAGTERDGLTKFTTENARSLQAGEITVLRVKAWKGPRPKRKKIRRSTQRPRLGDDGEVVIGNSHHIDPLLVVGKMIVFLLFCFPIIKFAF